MWHPLLPSKLPLPVGDLDPHLIHGSLDPPESLVQTASRSVQSLLQGSQPSAALKPTWTPVRTEVSVSVRFPPKAWFQFWFWNRPRPKYYTFWQSSLYIASCHSNTCVYTRYQNCHFFCTKKPKPVLGYNLKPVWTNRLQPNTSLFQHFLLLLWQSSNPSCSAAINEWHKGEMWQMVVNQTNIHSIHYWIRITKLHNEWNGIEWKSNNHMPDFSL